MMGSDIYIYEKKRPWLYTSSQSTKNPHPISPLPPPTFTAPLSLIPTTTSYPHPLPLSLPLPLNIMPHLDFPHRHHILLTPLLAAPAVHSPLTRRAGLDIIQPIQMRLFTVLSRVNPRVTESDGMLATASLVCFGATALMPTTTTTTTVGNIFAVALAGFEVLEAVGAGVGFGEAGPDLGGEGAGEEGAEEGEAGGDDADADFDVEPDARGGDGVCCEKGFWY